MDLSDVQIYRDGRFVRYGDAKVGLLTHGLNYGTGCFEGIRGYWNPDEEQLYFFRLLEHFERMQRSAAFLLMELPESPRALCERTLELVRRNGYRENLYVRPIAFKASEEIGVRLHNVKSDFAIIAVPHKSYFDASTGLRAAVSSWRRIDDNSAPARSKLTGVYVSSAIAKTEAVSNGFDEAILLAADGHVAEGSAENIFIVRGGEVSTPAVSDSILEGITRSAIMELLNAEMGLRVVERAIDRSELFCADEIFFTGTAVGVSPVIEVDRRPVGNGAVGKISAALANLYKDVATGRIQRYARWLTPCWPTRSVAQAPTARAAG